MTPQRSLLIGSQKCCVLSLFFLKNILIMCTPTLFSNSVAIRHTRWQAGYCWIGLLDCSIRIAIQFSGLDCDWQSKVKLGFWIWIVNPVFPFQSKSNNVKIIFHIIKMSWSLMLHLKKPSYFDPEKCLAIKLWVDKSSPLGITCFTNKKKLSKFAVIAVFLKLLDWDWDWIWIGLSIHFGKWIWIWIDNHIFMMDLDWIDNPKKLDWATAWWQAI